MKSIADELITRGWCQGAREDDEGRVCLRGAASYAWHGTVEDAFGLPYNVVQALRLLVGEFPATWNDRPGRTFDEVLRVAKEADEILGQQ